MIHEKIRLLLPEYVNGTLSAQEREETDAHLADCASCNRQVAEWQAIQSSVIALNEAVPAPSGDLFAAALKAIDADKRQDAPSPRITLFDKVANWVQEQWQTIWQPIPTVAWAVIAAQFVLVIGLIGFFSLREPTYSTLSGPSVVGSENRISVVIGFQPNVIEADMRKTLLEFQGTIIDGPSALGLYTIVFPIAKDSTDEIERKLDALKQRRDIFAFVERAS